MEGVLAGKLVIDLAGPEAALCGHLLAGFGAEVLKVQMPGPSGRERPPLAPSGESIEWFAWNRGKTAVQLDVTNSAETERLRELVDRADFVIESGEAGTLAGLGLDFDTVRDRNPGVVYISVSPFGRGGPYGQYRGGDLVMQAAGGHAYLDGLPERPMRLSAESSFVQASVQAAVGAMIAHYHRERTGAGQLVDLSMQEAVAYTLDEHPAAWDILRELHPRYGVGRIVSRTSLETTVFRCKDGWICSLYYFGIVGATFEGSAAIYERFGVDVSALRSEAWQKKLTVDYALDLTREDERTLRSLADDLASRATRRELRDACDAVGAWAGEVFSPAELLEDEHLAARGFWREARFAGRPVKIAGPPFILSASPWTVPAEVSEVDPGALTRRGVPVRTGDASPGSAGGVFSGLRVADFSWVGVGPIAARYLADQGAETIRVESTHHPDILRVIPPYVDDIADLDMSGYYAGFNPSKLGASLNFKHPRARELALRLIEKSDVVTDSYRPGVMERWGLRYEEVRERRPDIIWIRMPMFGLTGPRHDRAGYGNTLQAITGIYHLLGEPDGPPLGAGTAFTDFFATHFAGLALVAALEHRRKTGEGQMIEVAQMEAAMYMILPHLLEAQVTGRDPTRQGNRHPAAAPHNTYRCLGDDRFVAITCFTDAEWRSLVEEMQAPGLLADPRFATLELRKANEPELDAAVETWTRGQIAEEVMHRLQARGVPAAVVATITDLRADPQLAHRRHFRFLDHPRMGRRAYQAPAFRLSATAERLSRPAPLLGQHNDYVWRELVGMGDDEIAALTIEGAFE